MTSPSRSVIEGGPVGTAIAVLWLGFLGLVVLVGFYVAAFDGVFPVLRFACFVVALALAAGLWKVFRWMFPSEGRLRVDVGDDSIQFQMPEAGPM